MQQLDIRAFQEALEAAKSVLILLPQNPDVDGVASALSLKLAIEAGREVTVACVSQMTVEYNRLVGVETITDNPVNKNLIIEFDKVVSPAVDRVTWESADTLKLIVIPKPGYAAPTQNQFSLNYAGVNVDLVIVVKAENKASLGSIAENTDIFSATSKVVLISNFPTQGFLSPIEIINPQAICTSEVVFELLEEMAITLSPDIATNLLQGIKYGSASFQNVTSKTFTAASVLVESGANRGTLTPAGETQGFMAQPVNLVEGVVPQNIQETKTTEGTSVS